MGTHPIFESDFDCLTDEKLYIIFEMTKNPESLNIHERKRVMKELYSPWKRRQEWICIVVSALFMTMHGLYCLKVNYSLLVDPVHLLRMVVATLLGITTADFASGLVHWAADTWFKIDTPLVGKSLIRPFREHHIDPRAMLNHDFVETNADTFSLSIPFTVYSVYNFYFALKGQENYLWDTWLLALVVFVGFTNEFHKQSHNHKNVPALVQFLQRHHVILPPDHHRIHHVRPHANYYCITTGWLDPLLEKLNFWKNLERCVTALTGAIPRDDDMKWTKMDKDKRLEGN